jgi:hypothetical protein
MKKVEKIWKLGEKVEGFLLRPDEVGVRGVICGEGQYAVALEFMSGGGEPLTIMLPMEFLGTFIRLIEDAHDELEAAKTAQRS